MKIYLRKQLVFDTPTTKKEVYNFVTSGVEPLHVKKEPEWWRNFNTKEDALAYLTLLKQ